MLILKANKISSFKTELGKLQIKVPRRGEGRKAEHCEQYQINHFLRGMLESGLITLPVELIRRERPDFKLKLGDNMWGVETTEIVHPDFAKASTLSEAKVATSLLDPSLFKWGTKKRNNCELRDIASRNKLSGPGWSGESVEIEFARSIHDTVFKKHTKLANGYERYEVDCLLIYHNQTLPILDFDRGAELTINLLKDYWALQGFMFVYVQKHGCLARFSKNGVSWLVKPEDN